MKLLRKIFFPFVPVYFMVTSLRNKLFDWKVLNSKSYHSPIICVGNLSVGGTGKSPVVEYLIRLLKKDYKVATLSRGYKRKTSGFLLAEEKTTFNEIGDEPYQFKKKYKDILVAVDENRQRGIEELLKLDIPPHVILLDDAYQHRKVNAGLNILLTTYNKLFVDDWVLPTGDLREPRRGSNRAQFVVVTKCPNNLKSSEKKIIEKKLGLNENQNLFFSSILYDDLVYNQIGSIPLDSLKNKKITLVTGIANSKPLVGYLKFKNLNFEHLEFKDHYNFTEKDFETFKGKSLILTTEKDFVRIQDSLDHQNLYYLPISINIDKKEIFESLIKEFVASF